MRRLLAAVAGTIVATAVVAGSANAGAPARVRTCGTVLAGGGGPSMPRLTVTVQGGPVGCPTAMKLIRHFQTEITKHARVGGYTCTQIDVNGDERCVKGATVIRGTYRG